MSSKRFTVTAALPYTNGPIHIGHLAGVYVPSDIYVRYLRSIDKDVIYICGSDEHGVAISIKAKKEGVSPKEVINKYHSNIKKSFQEFGISFDNYSRTSNQIHHETASDFFLQLYNKNKLVEKITDQLYDSEMEQFLADRFVIGECPECQSKEAYGDQCEKCGSSLNAVDLINPKSTISGSTPILKKTKHWFLPLNNYEDFIKKFILVDHKNDWKSNVYGQVKSWIDSGLKSRAITRDLDWGIKVPLKNATGKVLYVWFDAPIGYISSTKEWAKSKNKDWKPYWQDKETNLIHFIGKDNIVFHCIIFPSILSALGNYILPKNVPANEFLNLEGKKISTSKNWAVWLPNYLKDFKNKQDVLRYALTVNSPENKDSDFTWNDFKNKNNNELVAIFGNFINRVTVLTHKYFMGKIPELDNLYENDKKIISRLIKFPKIIGSSIENFKFRDGCFEMMNLARMGNKFLAEEEPWKKIKSNPKRVKTIINLSAQIAATLSIVCEPFLPFTSIKLKSLLKIEKKIKWNQLSENYILLKDQHEINKPILLFDKIDDEEIELQIKNLKGLN